MYIMKRYTVSQVRGRLAEALDQADRGVPVIIERKGIRYSLKAEPPATARRWKKSVIEIPDPADAEGQWTWDRGPDGLRFRGGRSRRWSCSTPAPCSASRTAIGVCACCPPAPT